MTISRRSLITSSTAGLIASALTLPTIATASQTGSPRGATPTAGDPDLDAKLLATIEEHGIPGALVLVDSPESGLWTTAVGVANIDTGAPMTTDMHMRVGSITKTFTATMVLQLVDQDVLTLDDTLAAIAPELADLPNADSITIRHLLRVPFKTVARPVLGGSALWPDPSFPTISGPSSHRAFPLSHPSPRVAAPVSPTAPV